MEVKAKQTGRGFVLCVGEWESYYDGLKQDEWIESNKYWLDEITTDIDVQRQIFKAINEEDFRPNSCGGCI